MATVDGFCWEVMEGGNGEGKSVLEQDEKDGC